jgi:shikimate kinase
MSTSRKASPISKSQILPESGVLSFTGMRRTGKTEVSRIVAMRLGFPLFDTDQIFDSQYHITIDAFRQSSGWIGFRRVESGIIMDLFSRIGNRAIVSLGGGALAHGDSEFHRLLNLQRVKEKGLVVYLTPSPDLLTSARILADRELALGQDPNRPPLPQSDQRSKTAFEKTYDTLRQRHPLYMDACNGFVVYESDKQGTAQKMIKEKADQVIREMAKRLRV